MAFKPLGKGARFFAINFAAQFKGVLLQFGPLGCNTLRYHRVIQRAGCARLDRANACCTMKRSCSFPSSSPSSSHIAVRLESFFDTRQWINSKAKPSALTFLRHSCRLYCRRFWRWKP